MGRYDSVMKRNSKFREILPWLALGPVTGPLAWRMYRCIRAGDKVLATLYGVAIVGFWIGLAHETGQALAALAH